MSSLRCLNLESNRLRDLPCTFETVPLQELCLGRNDIRSLPRALRLMPLTDLSLDGCPLGSVDPWLAEVLTLVNLNLNKARLEEFPNPVIHLSALQNLSLRSNRIRSVPDELRELDRCLTTLDMSCNPLHNFPTVFDLTYILEYT